MAIYDSKKNIQFHDDTIAELLMRQEWYSFLPPFHNILHIQTSSSIKSSWDGAYYIAHHSIDIAPHIFSTKTPDSHRLSVILHELCHAYEAEIVQQLNSTSIKKHDFRIGLFSQLYEILNPNDINPYYYLGYTKDKINAFFHTDLTHTKQSYHIISYFPHFQNMDTHPMTFFNMNTSHRYFAEPCELLAATMQQIPYYWDSYKNELVAWLTTFSYYCQYTNLPEHARIDFNGLSSSDLKNINDMYYMLDTLEKQFDVIDAAYSTVLFHNTQRSASPLLTHKYDTTPVHLRAKALLHVYQQFKQGILSEQAFHEKITTPVSKFLIK